MSLSDMPAWVDATAIDEFQTCESRDFFAKRQGIVSAMPNIHLLGGGAFAKGVEVTRRQFFFGKMPADDALACGLEAMWLYYGDPEGLPEKNPKSIDFLSNALVAYFDQYKLGQDAVEPFILEGALTVEFSFSHPLPVKHPVTGLPILYCGRFDQIGKYRGQLFACDEKTASRFSYNNEKWDLRGQFIGYNWGAAQQGLKLAGTLVREVAIRSDGHADFKEALLFTPAFLIDKWLEETCKKVERMIEVWKAESWSRAYGRACEMCSYHRLCTTPDWQTFKEPYYKANDWSPLTPPEPLLRR
jgi:hypothetical protein